MRRALKTSWICLALLGSVSAVVRAEAADLGRSSSSYSAPMMTNNWAGFYGGLHVGYGTGRARNADITGFIPGVHAGFNLQSNQVVFGGEADLNYSNVDYHGFTDAFRQKWTGTLRARVGYAYDRFMPFFTVGVGFSSAQLKSGGVKTDNTHAGLVIGGGVEAMVTEKISATFTYLYHRDGAKTYVVLPAARSVSMSTNEFRIGLNYRF